MKASTPQLTPDLSETLNSCIAHIIDMIKGCTAFVLGKEFGVVRKLWAPSKFVSSVGVATLDVVKKYIESKK